MTQQKYTKEELKMPSVQGNTDLDRYKYAVELGKLIVHNVTCYQVKLAHLAVQVCTIRHGGISNKIYTIKDFAKDININAKTLQNWVVTYRNVIQKVEINPNKVTPEIWSAASRIRNNHEIRESENRKSLEISNKKYSGKIEKTKEEIKKELDDAISGNYTDQYKCTNWSNELSHIANNIINCDLKKVDRVTLNNMLSNTLFIKNQLDIFLSKR